MSDILIKKIASRVEAEVAEYGIADEQKMLYPLPITFTDLLFSEHLLGFRVPELWGKVLSEVGNGGYGPGYGFLGLFSGARDESGLDSIDIYSKYREPAPNIDDWAWPEKLLPICHWGCDIYSCIDCKAAPHPVILFDPHMLPDDVQAAFIPHMPSLESFLESWANGENLWEKIYGKME